MKKIPYNKFYPESKIESDGEYKSAYKSCISISSLVVSVMGFFFSVLCLIFSLNKDNIVQLLTLLFLVCTIFLTFFSVVFSVLTFNSVYGKISIILNIITVILTITGFIILYA